MASLAEHFSSPVIDIPQLDPVSIAASLPVGLFCVSVTLFVFSCSMLALGPMKPRKAD